MTNSTTKTCILKQKNGIDIQRELEYTNRETKILIYSYEIWMMDGFECA